MQRQCYNSEVFQSCVHSSSRCLLLLVKTHCSMVQVTACTDAEAMLQRQYYSSECCSKKCLQFWFNGRMFLLLLLQKTHYSVVQVTQHAEAMLQSQHYNSELVRAIAENVTLAWQQLMYHAEERQKLVMASTNWYKTAEQVGFLWLLSRFLFLG